MATGGLYGNASESVGLYGNTTNFGGSYFEWFIFYQSDTQPVTPTGGSWSFVTNTGTAPAGWSTVPFPAPTLPVWVSIALVNSRSDVPLVWSAPGLFSYSSGLPILSGSGTPSAGDGINSQLYIQTSTTPQTIWFKQSGTWNRLVGSTLYADLTTNQTVAGIKTFSSPIVGSVTGTAANVTGIVPIVNGGTGSTTANGAFNALAPSQTSQAGKYLTTDGTNTSWGTNPLGTVTSVDVSGGTTGLTTSGGPVTTSGTITLAGTLAVANGGTGATTAGVALTNLGAVGTIASADASIVVTQVGSSVDLSVSTTSPASVLLEQVRNTTGATLTKGTAVYISGATGQIPTVSKALATSDATSAQTLGLITADLPNNSNGYVTIIGLVANLNTSAYTDGQQLYLSPITAGTLTATKPYAPQHLVYMAVVAHAHPTQGKLLVKVQNGYELDELHNVAAQSPTTGQTIVWNSATSLWEKNTVSLTVGVNGTLPILNGGTGQTTANAAFNALAPNQTGNSGKYLTTDGSNSSWATNPLGTVTSVGGTGTVNGITLTGTVTSSGNLTLGGTLSGVSLTSQVTGTLPTANGGTNLTSFTSGGVVYASSSSALATGSALTFDGTKLGINTASPVRTLSIANGGPVVEIDPAGGTAGPIYFNYNRSTATYLTPEYWALSHIWNVSGGTEAMRLTSTGLGIGTSSALSKLVVSNGSGKNLEVQPGATTYLFAYDRTASDYLNLDIAGKTITFGTPATGLTLTSSSLYTASGINVGIGNSNPAFKLDVNVGSNGSGIVTALRLKNEGTSGGDGAKILFTAGTSTDGAGIGSGGVSLNAADLRFYTGGNTERVKIDVSGNVQLSTASTGILASDGYTMLNQTPTVITIGATNRSLNFACSASANAMVLDTSGNLLVGTTSLPSASSGGAAFVIASSGRAVLRLGTTTTGSIGLAEFYNPNGSVGEIIVNGTATSYNTSSDYRLKNTITPMTGALAKVALLKPCTYKWNVNGSDGEGFIAHELAEVVPQCVSGEKDAVDAEGNPKYQGIDTSFLVATLTAAIQELKAEFDAYKASHP